MKAAGFFLLFTGFVIVLSAFALLSSSARAPFVWAGIAVQLLGLVLTFRSHLNLDEEQ